MFKKAWHWILALFGVLIGMLSYERIRRKAAETKLSNAEYQKEDAVLAEKQAQVQTSIQEQKQKIEEMKNDQATQSPPQDLTPEQIREYWRNRGKT